MGYQLASGVTACVVDRSVVFLDVVRDRYACASIQASAELIARSAQPIRAERVVLAPLVQRRLLAFAPDAPDQLAWPVNLKVRSSLLDDDIATGMPDLAAVSATALAIGGASWRLQRRGLHGALPKCVSSAPIETVSPGIVAAARRYRAARLWLPYRPLCLVDSLALHEVLHARRERATLIIGVRLAPFRAHCWLQAGDAVLNDTADHVRAYRQILVCR